MEACGWFLHLPSQQCDSLTVLLPCFGLTLTSAGKGLFQALVESGGARPENPGHLPTCGFLALTASAKSLCPGRWTHGFLGLGSDASQQALVYLPRHPKVVSIVLTPEQRMTRMLLPPEHARIKVHGALWARGGAPSPAAGVGAAESRALASSERLVRGPAAQPLFTGRFPCGLRGQGTAFHSRGFLSVCSKCCS